MVWGPWPRWNGRKNPRYIVWEINMRYRRPIEHHIEATRIQRWVRKKVLPQARVRAYLNSFKGPQYL